ncbi:MAG: hypothetical protein KAI94_15550, partial [Anaerolineales bacterium]|nr:hypothetical protein [Anaerolineales bacterium]
KEAAATDRRNAAPTTKKRVTARKRETSAESPTFDLSPTFVLAITPETADMELNELTALFKKIRQAMRRAATDD